eukprot:XP_001699096.1 predicted protein [Chlamydomonas reinhardtii]
MPTTGWRRRQPHAAAAAAAATATATASPVAVPGFEAGARDSRPSSSSGAGQLQQTAPGGGGGGGTAERPEAAATRISKGWGGRGRAGAGGSSSGVGSGGRRRSFVTAFGAAAVSAAACVLLLCCGLLVLVPTPTTAAPAAGAAAGAAGGLSAGALSRAAAALQGAPVDPTALPVELNPSVMVLGEFDWVPYQVAPPYTSRCTDMVDRAKKVAGGSRVNFVPTHYWKDRDEDGSIDSFCYMDRTAAWRNGLVFNPNKAYGGLSYAQVMLEPLVDALAAALAAKPDWVQPLPVWMALQGEMSATVLRYPHEYTQLLSELKERLLRRMRAAGASEAYVAAQRELTQVGVSFNFNKVLQVNTGGGAGGGSAASVLSRFLGFGPFAAATSSLTAFMGRGLLAASQLLPQRADGSSSSGGVSSGSSSSGGLQAIRRQPEESSKAALVAAEGAAPGAATTHGHDHRHDGKEHDGNKHDGKEAKEVGQAKSAEAAARAVTPHRIQAAASSAAAGSQDLHAAAPRRRRDLLQAAAAKPAAVVPTTAAAAAAAAASSTAPGPGSSAGKIDILALGALFEAIDFLGISAYAALDDPDFPMTVSVPCKTRPSPTSGRCATRWDWMFPPSSSAATWTYTTASSVWAAATARWAPHPPAPRRRRRACPSTACGAPTRDPPPTPGRRRRCGPSCTASSPKPSAGWQWEEAPPTRSLTASCGAWAPGTCWASTPSPPPPPAPSGTPSWCRPSQPTTPAPWRWRRPAAAAHPPPPKPRRPPRRRPPCRPTATTRSRRASRGGWLVAVAVAVAVEALASALAWPVWYVDKSGGATW